MAKSRYVNTRMWDDDYFSNLDPIEKLLFLYLLTNSSTDICGIYEIPLKTVAVDTGIDRETVQKILDRFGSNDKIHYVNGWVALVNSIKHQTLNPSVRMGIKMGLNKAPLEIMDRLGTEWVQSVNSLLDLNSNNNSNLNPNTNAVPAADSFQEFWKAYPNKKAKAKAEQSWVKISPDRKQLSEVLSALEKVKRTEGWTKEGGKFVPHPATWLNQKRWTDEVEAAPAEVDRF